MKKVIFLDIDGVLNTSYTKYRDEVLDDFRLDYLAKIVNKTHAKISSLLKLIAIALKN